MVSSALLIIFFRSIQKLSKKYELYLNFMRHREGEQGKKEPLLKHCIGMAVTVLLGHDLTGTSGKVQG